MIIIIITTTNIIIDLAGTQERFSRKAQREGQIGDAHREKGDIAGGHGRQIEAHVADVDGRREAALEGAVGAEGARLAAAEPPDASLAAPADVHPGAILRQQTAPVELDHHIVVVRLRFCQTGPLLLLLLLVGPPLEPGQEEGGAADVVGDAVDGQLPVEGQPQAEGGAHGKEGGAVREQNIAVF